MTVRVNMSKKPGERFKKIFESLKGFLDLSEYEINGADFAADGYIDITLHNSERTQLYIRFGIPGSVYGLPGKVMDIGFPGDVNLCWQESAFGSWVRSFIRMLEPTARFSVLQTDFKNDKIMPVLLSKIQKKYENDIFDKQTNAVKNLEESLKL